MWSYLRQQTRMMDRVIRQFISVQRKLFPLRLSSFPRPHSCGHEKSSRQMMFLENGSGMVEISIDSIIECERDRGSAILRPASDADFRLDILGRCHAEHCREV